MLIGYARVSTDKQTDRAQLDALRAANCERVFTETASGRDDARPQLALALDQVRAGDTLVAFKLDRLARSAHKLLEIRDALEAKGAYLRLLDGAIIGDTSTPSGAMIFTVLAAMAEFEAAIIRERTREGLKAAKARGKQGGRPPVDAAKVEAARAMIDGGLSHRNACRTAGIGRTSFYRAINAAPQDAPTQPPKRKSASAVLREIEAREAAPSRQEGP